MKIQVCPRCGSSNIEWVLPQNWSLSSCNDCGFTGPVIEVNANAQKKLQKKWAKNH